jgi:hypothetical protein
LVAALRDREWKITRRYMRDDFSITTAGWVRGSKA